MPMLVDTVDVFEQRKAAALAAGWTCTKIGDYYFVGSPTYTEGGTPTDYHWIAVTEERAWWGVLMRPNVYAKLTALLGVG